ncbi:heat stress transcription factor B-1-like [Dorcoceras hygrometricum]|uniref:Heat stress transcription factor B-1-like n=1 Tax=Dorcoceras hygrometricum TaxID=472368 RepID=A0A2Z7ATY7_9LAMI|nr:heat stress transcription factor B-1-like [Dorcoceras hygrometricum]
MAQRCVPSPFITKTYSLVDDPSSNDVVSWNEDGTTFVVWKTAEFARVLLPNYFKHNNFSSFVRQLNTYGFRKIAQNKWEFCNDNFRRGQQELLTQIHRRKIAPPQPPPGNPASPGDELGSSTTGSLDTQASPRITDLSDENEKLRKDNQALNLELVQTKRQCNDLICFLSKNMQVDPDQINRVLSRSDSAPMPSVKCVRLFGVILKK